MSSSVAWRAAGSLSADMLMMIGFGGWWWVESKVVLGLAYLKKRSVDESRSEGELGRA